tara:strand:+ start:1265 stop:1414 length:150 start_codon:yes stop_codon:yes gene_type:complete
MLFVAITVENNDSASNNKHKTLCLLAEILALFKTNDGIKKYSLSIVKSY